jgi:hypothetical protein
LAIAPLTKGSRRRGCSASWASALRIRKLVRQGGVVALKSKLVNGALGVMGAINLIAGTAYMVFGHVAAGGAGIAAGLVLLLASSLERFEVLKGLGMEAKMRDLQDTISRADAVLARIKQLAEVTCRALVHLHTTVGRRDSAPSPREVHRLAKEVKEILQTVDAGPAVIREALNPWIREAATGAAMQVLYAHSQRLCSLSEELNKQLSLHPNPVETDDDYVRLRQRSNDLRMYVSFLSNRQPAEQRFGFGPLVSAQQTAVRLRKTTADGPDFVPPETLAPFRRDADFWADAIESLDRELAYRDEAMWFEQLEKPGMFVSRSA